MQSWFAENLANIAVAAVLIAVVAVVVIRLVKNKRTGKSSCGCGCQSCPMGANCRQKK